MPIIDVGGAGSGRDAYKKLQVRVSLVQVYNMLVYKGPRLLSHRRKELVGLLAENMYRSIDDVLGPTTRTITGEGGRRRRGG